MDIRGKLSLRLNETTSLLLSLCLLFATLYVRTVRTTRAPYTGSVGKPDTTTICDCPMSSAFLTCQTSAEECESDEVRDGDSCYRFISETPKTHEESLLDCIERNSHLVYIESMQEQNFIVSHASSSTLIDYWIGLVAGATYIWSDGSLKLPDLFPVVGSVGDCVHVVRSSGVLLFYTSHCDQHRNFVCESDRTPTGCPMHLHPFGNSCYEIVRGNGRRKSHDAARRYCEALGGHLVYVETMEELDDVRNQLQPNDFSYWIGLTVVRYHWMDGSPALFQTFESANGDDGNECFRMRPHSLNWNDRGCHNLFGYICERQLSTAPSSAPSSQIIDQSVQCPSWTPSDLMFLSQSGALCIDDEDHTTPVLRSCDTWDGIDGCGCGQTNDDLVSCSVGSCKMTFNDTDRKWPSEFNCSCSSGNGSTPFKLIADQGTIGCLIQLPPPTTLMSTTSISTTTLSTTTQSPIGTSTVEPTTAEVTSNRLTTVVTDLVTTDTTTQSQPTTVSVDASTEISTTTPQIPTQTSITTLLTNVATSTGMTDINTVKGTIRTTENTMSTSVDQIPTSPSTTETPTSTSEPELERTATAGTTPLTVSHSQAASPTATTTTTTTAGPSTSRDSLTAESGAASGRRGGNDDSTGLTVGVTVAAVSVVGVVVGALVWKKMAGKLALKASKGSLGSSLSPSSQSGGSPNAGVNPMYGISGDTVATGSDVLAGVTEGGMHGVRNPTFEEWKEDTDPLEV